MAAVIVTQGLSKSFGAQVALSGLDLEVQEGEILGYLGPNGAGKTTTIRLLLGLISPTAGSATIFGLDVTSQAPEVHRRLAYVPGEANLWPGLSGAETLALLGRVHGHVDGAYRDELIERFDFDPAKKVRSYSKGNRQKLSLIAALMTRAELLMLDEPTAGLDPLMEQTFRECMRESKRVGQTVFLSSHILSEVEALCDRVAILRNGELLQIGTLAELRHLSALTIHVTFAGEVPDVGDVPGVSAVAVEGQRLSCELTGPIQPLLERLTRYDVRELLSAKPSLEELFLSHYGGAGGTA
ncbi:MAG: ABC transporter ATP-binding protein [Chloroflexota bacterium]|nr:ABC transporter ATP-binding protein [Chloroflexota bacterium]MDE3192793.1 ABC transporter ATP-binding protein [Chloroflexota bacterium]